jgi:cytochrome bd ubiquinol oxidase subunit I
MVALGTNLSALWILIANGWMQNPAGAFFNPDTMRMEISDFPAVFFNPIAQAKFVHTVSAGYVIAAATVLGISAYWLLKGRWVEVARRSMVVAVGFGLASSVSVLVLGDASGYALTDNQKMKLAAIEAAWRTAPAPAGLTLIGMPDSAARTTHYEVQVPWVLGLIATHSFDKEVTGMSELVLKAQERIGSGVHAYDALERIKANPGDRAARAEFELNRHDLGYALLLKRHLPDPRSATPEQIAMAAWDTVPSVPLMFWSFRIMAAISLAMIALFAFAFVLCTIRKEYQTRWFLRTCVAAIAFPWIAAELGWVVAEMGRQPWAIEGVLPTFLATSSLTRGALWTTLFGFTLLYAVLAVIEVRLILATVRKGPFEHAEDDKPAPGPIPARPVVA